MSPTQALKEAIDLAGGYAALGRLLTSKDKPEGIKGQAVWQWRVAPPLHVLAIEQIVRECRAQYLAEAAASTDPAVKKRWLHLAERCAKVTKEALRPDLYVSAADAPNWRRGVRAAPPGKESVA